MRNFDPLFFSNEKKNYYYYYSYSYSSFSSRVYYILGEKKDSNLEFGIFSPRSRFVYRKEGGEKNLGREKDGWKYELLVKLTCIASQSLDKRGRIELKRFIFLQFELSTAFRAIFENFLSFQRGAKIFVIISNNFKSFSLVWTKLSKRGKGIENSLNDIIRIKYRNFETYFKMSLVRSGFLVKRTKVIKNSRNFWHSV